MHLQPQASIGVFDSGVGGLTVLNALRAVLPHENYVYFGDTLHMPYGSKTPQALLRLVTRILSWMIEEQQVKYIAVACNTSAGALREMLATVQVPIIEPITPVCEWIASQTPWKQVGLMATPATVQSQQYQRVLQRLQPGIQVTSVACDGLARFIEQGETQTSACQEAIKSWLHTLNTSTLEALILGCTHYPHIAAELQTQLPPHVALLDPAQWMGQAVQTQLAQLNLLNPQTTSGQIQFYVSHQPEQFLQVSQQLPLPHVPLVLPALAILSPLTEPQDVPRPIA